MLDVLAQLEQELPAMLQDESIWRSVYVDYHPPIVERLWTSWRTYRVYLHRIHPCEREQALFHPHPWPSAMRVLEGKYEMAVGFGSGMEEPPVAALMVSSGDFHYEMTHPDSWHYVRPLGTPTLSVMLTGKPWDRESHKSTKALQPLSAEQAAELLAIFQARYPAGAK